MRLVDYVNLIRKTPDNKELKLAFHQACYEIYDRVNGDYKELMKISELEGLGAVTIRKYAVTYMKVVLNMSEEEQYDKYVYPKIMEAKRDKKIRPTPTNQLLLKLVEERDQERIVQLISESKLYVGDIKSRISGFVYSYFPDVSDYLVDDLKKKVNIFIERDKKIRRDQALIWKEKSEQEKFEREKEIYAQDKKILEDFIYGDYGTKEVYCQINCIPVREFDKIRDMAKKYDLETYQKYREKIDKLQSQRWNIIVDEIKKMLYFMEKGIEVDDNQMRPFDIIDYYEITKINFEELSVICKYGNLSSEELRTLKIFMNKNKNNVRNNIGDVSQFLNPNSVHIVAGKVVELETKQKVVEFLKKKQIPQNQGTCLIALRRYLNGTLSWERVDNYGKIRK